MKEKVVFGLIWLVAFAAGSTVGNVVSHFAFPHPRHMCECDYCKAVRKQEAVEVVDSIVRERIVISIGREERGF